MDERQNDEMLQTPTRHIFSCHISSATCRKRWPAIVRMHPSLRLKTVEYKNTGGLPKYKTPVATLEN